MKTSGNTILITGGASGIGRALAHRFNDLGNFVIVAGRRQEALDEAVDGRSNMSTFLLDVADPDDIAVFARRVVQAHPALNILINNAGIMKFEDLTSHRELVDMEATINANLLGPIRLTNNLIDHLTQQNDAAVINLTSGLAFVPLVTTPTYNATKAAMHSYTLSLREQLKGKVEVIKMAPPAVQTDLTPGQATREGYMPLDQFIDEAVTLLQQQPTPAEILVERVGFLRWAEKEDRFNSTMAMLNTPQ